MNRDEFKNQLDRLNQFFGCKNYAERLDHYWKRLSNFSENEMLDAVGVVLDEGKVFPSVNRLRSVLWEIRRNQAPEHKERANCPACDGWGWLFEGGNAYRARCAHGDALSKTIPLASPNLRKPSAFGNDLVAWALKSAEPNPVRFFRSFLMNQGVLKKMNPEKWQAVAKALAELVGVEKAREMWSNKEGLEIVKSI